MTLEDILIAAWFLNLLCHARKSVAMSLVKCFEHQGVVFDIKQYLSLTIEKKINDANKTFLDLAGAVGSYLLSI